jgi:TRAP-type C4-dicarboxylate transport system permease small subunit
MARPLIAAGRGGNMTALDRWTGAVERAFLYLTGAGLFAIMMVIVTDVVLRYFFSAPLSWSYDLIGMYLVTLVFFLALADTFRRGAHIKVDLFEALRGTRLMTVAEIIGYCASLVLFALVFHQMAVNGLDAFLANDVVDGAIPWPTWPPYLFGAVGVGLLIIRVALAIVGRAAALLAGRPFEQEGSGEHRHGEHAG